MSNELKPCPFCGGEANVASVKFHKDSESAKLNGRTLGYFGQCIRCSANLSFDLCDETKAEAIVAWNCRHVCDDKHGKAVYAGDEVRGHIRLCNRNDDDPEYDEGIIAFDSRGLIWRLRTGPFRKSIIANYDEIELIESESEE